MEVREIRKNDLEKIIELIKQGIPYVLPYNVYVYWILQNYYSSTCKVVESEDKIIGYISGIPSLDKETIFIWQLCVDIKHRGDGIGTMMIDSLVSEAKRLGYCNIQLSISDTNIASQTLFKSYAEKKSMEIYEKGIEKFEDQTEFVFQINIV